MPTVLGNTQQIVFLLHTRQFVKYGDKRSGKRLSIILAHIDHKPPVVLRCIPIHRQVTELVHLFIRFLGEVSTQITQNGIQINMAPIVIPCQVLFKQIAVNGLIIAEFVGSGQLNGKVELALNFGFHLLKGIGKALNIVRQRQISRNIAVSIKEKINIRILRRALEPQAEIRRELAKVQGNQSYFVHPLFLLTRFHTAPIKLSRWKQDGNFRSTTSTESQVLYV